MRPNQHLILPVVLSIAACAPVGSKSGIKDIVPFEVGNIEPKLGAGYDSLTQELRNTPSCVSGTPTKQTSDKAEINLDQNADSGNLMREFSGEVTGTPRLVFFEMGAATGYYRSLNKRSSTVSLVYSAKIQTGSEQFADVAASSSASSMSKDAVLNACGDHYVVQINRGGLLTITISLDFGSDENRSKWQNKLKLNGSWAEVSSDIGKKLEDSGIDGSLSVSVNQVGGNPGQSLQAVPTCSLSSKEDFDACKQKIDDLMAYARNAFPQQVEARPAVLNYTTAPLSGLGISGLPSLPTTVIEARRTLEVANQENLMQQDMLGKASKVNLPVDGTTKAAVEANTMLIKQAAKACYSYQVRDAAVDFSNCLSQARALASSLRAINPEALAINDLGVPADSESGESIVNPYGFRMQISYAVLGRKTWRYDASSTVNADGTSPSGLSSAVKQGLSNSDKRGALLVRSLQGYRRADASGTAEIGPGEALGFVMNEELGKYGDNQGSQTVYWRCTNCQTKQTKLATFKLKIKAADGSGTPFRSDVNLRGSYKATAYGRWGGAWASPATDADGASGSCNSECPAPGVPKQALILFYGVVPGGELVGRHKTISIDGHREARFIFNDERGGYRDNYGEIELILQCVVCDLKSHPLIIDEAEGI